MDSVKYIVISLIVLGAFVGGLLFSHFIVQSTALSGRDITLNQVIQIKKNVDFDTYKSTLWLNGTEQISSKPIGSAQDKQNIEQLFKSVLERAKKNNLCLSGTFSLSPTFQYANGQKIQRGQQIDGSIICNISKKDIETYRALLKDLDYMVLKSGYASLAISPLEPTLKDDEKDEIYKEIYDEIIQKAMELSTHYAQILHKSCTIKSISEAHENVSNMLKNVSFDTQSAKSDSVAVGSEPPLDTHIEIVLRSGVELRCW